MFKVKNEPNRRVVRKRDRTAVGGIGDNGGPPLTDNPFSLGFSSGFGDGGVPDTGGFSDGFEIGFDTIV